MVSRIFPLVADDDVLTEIGRLCAHWSFAEALAEAIIWRALELPSDIGEFYTTKLDLRGRCELLNSIAKARISSKEDRAALKVVTERFRSLQDDRNIYVHGVPTRDLQTWTDSFLFSRRGKYAHKELRVDVETIKSLNDEIGELSFQLQEIGWRLWPVPEKEEGKA